MMIYWVCWLYEGDEKAIVVTGQYGGWFGSINDGRMKEC